MSDEVKTSEASLLDRLTARFYILKSGVINDLENQVSFTVGRSKLVSNDRDHYLFSAHNSMHAVKTFCCGFGVGLLAFLSVRNSKSRFGATPMRRLFHSFFWGYTAGLLYGPLTKIGRFEKVCNLEDNYFSKVAREIVRRHPSADELLKVIHFDSPDVDRRLHIVSNYRFSGFPAIVTTKPDEPAPEESIPLDENEYFNESIWAWNRKIEQENMTEENADKLGQLNDWTVPKYLENMAIDVYTMPVRPRRSE